MPHLLDNPVWDALGGPQRAVALRDDLAAHYLPDISSFGAFPEPPEDRHWAAMADLVGPGGRVIVTGPTGTPPDGWAVEFDGVGVQMTGEALDGTPDQVAATRPDLAVEPLGDADAEAMAGLVDLARPGPFSSHTHTLGGYVGVRADGRLVAMAGQRFRPTGWCEISAVATHPAYRRRGLGEHLVRMVAAGIVDRGERPLLHASADNAGAIRLYEAMGFTHRARVRFLATRVPGDPGAASSPVPPPVRPGVRKE